MYRFVFVNRTYFSTHSAHIIFSLLWLCACSFITRAICIWRSSARYNFFVLLQANGRLYCRRCETHHEIGLFVCLELNFYDVFFFIASLQLELLLRCRNYPDEAHSRTMYPVGPLSQRSTMKPKTLTLSLYGNWVRLSDKMSNRKEGRNACGKRKQK